jgi:hypothetical protein
LKLKLNLFIEREKGLDNYYFNTKIYFVKIYFLQYYILPHHLNYLII